MESATQAKNAGLAMELVQHLSAKAVVRTDEPLAKRTTLRVGGPADVYVEPTCVEDLKAVLAFCSEHELNCFVLGQIGRAHV